MKIDWRTEYPRLLGGRRSGFFDPDIMRREGFPLQRRLTETDLREAEGELGITFPSEYREHLLRRGNPERGFNRLWRGPRGWGWYGDTQTNYELLTEPFPHPDSYRVADDDLDEHEPPREDTEAWEAWDDECGVLEERKTAGAVYLQEGGCVLHPPRRHRSSPRRDVVRRPRHLRADPPPEMGRSARVLHGVGRAGHEPDPVVNQEAY
ncbi:SMI1/KNR4 family protein [Streptomyces filamentosus]|uniref:Knr4/Smi1-like domain-containing protein n=1 Tax=Streptomyces filamentosus TaxID=67294 RepID=A0A919ESX6_STRFL|nr:SMI1/KNR4 family protein [Streptomyces filamentosus]GHG23818.1 hypothetical protein GCM10017667_69130 [Streptomyces filamentosus]